MTVNIDDFSIIRTKLHRPRVPKDHVHRVKLLEKLQNSDHRPAILVSASAGYGKSTLVSYWLEMSDRPYAWLSLDENDNELKVFLAYFMAGIESMFPDAVTHTMSMVSAPNLPPIQAIVSQLVNELDAIAQDFVLVLDDIHSIRERSIHDFLDSLLRYPPRPMHLVFIGRRDPFLTIPTLRARNQLGEIRIHDLRFTTAETASYLQQMLQTPVEIDAAAAWAKKLEGWVTGLRLAALSIKHHGEMESILPRIQGETQYIMEYLFNEVLSHQPAAIQNFLLKTSILGRFCNPLCDAVCNAVLDSETNSDDTLDVIQILQKENLFLVNLDAEDRWFRYHHLFQQLLQNQLKQQYSPDKITALHDRASQWFESQELIEESIEHALHGENVERAAEIIDQYRHDRTSTGQWQAVERWLYRLPVEIKQQWAALILAEAWVVYMRFQLDRLPQLVKQAEALIDNQTAKPYLLAELNFFKGNLLYWQGEPEASVRHLETAQAQWVEKRTHLYGDTQFILALSRHMLGKEALVTRTLTDHIREISPSEKNILPYLFGGLAFTLILSGKLTPAGQQARQFQLSAEKAKTPGLAAISQYLQACVHLHTFDLEQAAHHFTEANQQCYIMDTQTAIDSLIGLALTQHFSQQPDEARLTIDRLLVFAGETNDPNCLSLANSGQARLALLSGKLATAAQWVHSVGEIHVELPSLFLWLEVPCLTQARVLIAIGSTESLNQAVALLRTIRQTSDTCRFANQTLEVAVLQSLALEKQGRTDDAMVMLEEAMFLAEPGGWVRPFVEAGPVMGKLLKRLLGQKVAVDHVTKILTALDQTVPENVQKPSGHDHRAHPKKLTRHPDGSSQALIEPLTNRELEVLDLLALRLQNKEIAEKLFISHQTVNSHLKNIYQKLGVNKRLKAVQKARLLEII